MRHSTGIAVEGVARYLAGGLNHGMEEGRLATMGYALLAAGCSHNAAFPGYAVANAVVKQQRPDGGWSDVEESLWCLGYLKEFMDTARVAVDSGRLWVSSQRTEAGGWGRTARDNPRIPITGLACALCPEIVTSHDLAWLKNEWEADLGRPTRLTYKAGFFLLGQRHPLAPARPDLVARTVDLLRAEQDDDGGFGPWRDHPCGSDPWSTGVVLWGLSRVPDVGPRDTIERAVAWLEHNQLPNGLWPYHYLDEGSSLALIGLSSALPLLD